MYVENGSWVGRWSAFDSRCDPSTAPGIGTHWWKLKARPHRTWPDTPSPVEVQRVRPAGYKPARQDSQCVPPTPWSHRDRATHVIPFAGAKADLTPCLLRAPARQGKQQQDDGGETVGGVPWRAAFGHSSQQVRL